ncbi:MAG TPA: carboxypeptidase-like regulatory domain-containing protein [Candidatus Nitrosotenuis sp.]|nr:carboxypeptidase-like regulatory domain-containing protein [Candidatus Nitrosotenuis sp.]
MLIIAATCAVGLANAQSEDRLVITAKFEQGESPSITGLVSDESKKPVGNATVFIATEFGTTETRTNSDGVFVFLLPGNPESARFDANIKAQKDGYQDSRINTSFFVGDEIDSNKLGPSYKIITADKINEDPIALKILQNIEKNKQEEEKRLKRLQEIKEQQQFLEQQRKLAEQDLLKDLGVWFEQLDPFNPRNAFATFVSQVDATVQDIYWAQFNFTEAKTKEGLAALQAVLDSGGTPQQARKAFYDKAATPRDELLKLNNKLNAEYAKNITKSRPDT